MEEIMAQLGDFGPYQVNQYLLQLISGFTAGLHMLALTFTAATPDHRCYIEEVDGDILKILDRNNMDSYFPREEDGLTFSSCEKFSAGSNTSTESCGDQYVFDTTYYHTTRVTEWNLVCDKSWQKTLLQSIYMCGVLFGALFNGAMADRFGRKPMFCLSAVLQFLFGMACAFAPTYELYAIAQFFYGAFGPGGTYIVGFTLAMEVVGPSKKTVCGTAFSIAFGFGVMEVACWAWLFPYGVLIQTICAAHGILLCGHWWLMDESIPWLWSKGRFKEAADIAINASRLNGVYLKPELVEPPEEAFSMVTIDASTVATNADGKNTKGILALFLYPNLRCRMLIMCYAWFANSLVYYGLSFAIGDLPGNPFLMGILSGLAELPGYIVVLYWLDRLGRRSLECILCFLGGLACISVAFIPDPTVVITFAMLAKVAIAGSFAIVYNYAAELFPTSVRSSVLGMTTMAARAAGMTSPAIIYLAKATASPTLPTLVFGGVAVLSAFLTLFLPETTGKEMPEGLDDGEQFGKGDTAFRQLCGKPSSKKEETVTELKEPKANLQESKLEITTDQ